MSVVVVSIGLTSYLHLLPCLYPQTDVANSNSMYCYFPYAHPYAARRRRRGRGVQPCRGQRRPGSGGSGSQRYLEQALSCPSLACMQAIRGGRVWRGWLLRGHTVWDCPINESRACRCCVRRVVSGEQVSPKRQVGKGQFVIPYIRGPGCATIFYVPT